MLQIKEKIDTFCKNYPTACELYQNILTHPCFWTDIKHSIKALQLFFEYKTGKSTKNNYQKQFCKISSQSIGCHLGCFAGSHFGKYYIRIMATASKIGVVLMTKKVTVISNFVQYLSNFKQFLQMYTIVIDF